ncbi:MAG: hypothetical protein JOZ31_04980 [Verrucomicrobia bacterium]|nr:hypothetical protein [Verrucomicrobiota bacterium]
MSIAKHVLALLLLAVTIQRLSGETYKPSITSWTPSSAGFESTAALPHGAEIRILVVTTGHTAHSQGEIIIYPESLGYAVNPVARWPFVKNGQSLVFRVEKHTGAGGRFYIEAGTPSPYLRADSCTRHADYDQLTFDKGWILNVKVLHEF